MKEKTDNIDILEEMIKPIATRTFIFPDGRKEEKEIYNLERKQIEAIENLIAENKELKERNKTMLSDEEKKAIKNIKKEFEKNHILPDIANEDLGTLLNLVETLIAENKEVKEEIEKLKENNGYHLGFIDGGIAKRYEYEYKIKAKIEEVEQWGLYNMKIPKLSTLDERLGAKIGIKYVLQSLLGKE